MTTRTVAVKAPFGAITTLRVGNFLNTVFQSIVDWNKNRKTQKALNGLTDAQLDDIGLTRGELPTL